MLILKPVENSRVVEILATSDEGLYRIVFVSVYDLFDEKEVYDKLRNGETVKVGLQVVEEK